MSALQKFVSACVLIFVAAAIALCVSGIATQHWLKVDTQFQGNFTFHRMLFKLDVDIEAHTGLRQCCLKTNIDVDLSRVPPLMLDIVKRAINKMPTKTNECVHADNTTNTIDSSLSRSLVHFKHIFVCLVLGLVAMCSAFIALTVKTFSARCRKIESQKSARSAVISIVLMVIAAMPIAVAVIIGHTEMHGEAEFVDLGITHYENKFIDTLPFAPKPSLPPTTPKPTLPPTVPSVDDDSDDDWDDDDWSDDDWDDDDSAVATEQQATPESSVEITTPLPTTKSAMPITAKTEPSSDAAPRRTVGAAVTVSSLKTTISPSGVASSKLAAKESSRVRRAARRKSSRRRRKRHDPMIDVRRILAKGRRNIKADLEKSHSYSLIIAGLFVLLLAVCGALIELCLEHRPSTAGSDTSSNRLVMEDGYDLSEKVRMEDGTEWKIMNLSDEKVYRGLLNRAS